MPTPGPISHGSYAATCCPPAALPPGLPAAPAVGLGVVPVADDGEARVGFVSLADGEGGDESGWLS